MRFCDDISGDCPISNGSCMGALTDSLSENRYASKCVAAFGNTLKYLAGCEITQTIRETLLEIHDKRRAAYVEYENTESGDEIRKADLAPIFLDERAKIIDSHDLLFANEEKENEQSDGFLVTSEGTCAIV